MITAMTTELLASIANTAGVVVVVAALATLVVGLLERTHRRESGLGHAPTVHLWQRRAEYSARTRALQPRLLGLQAVPRN